MVAVVSNIFFVPCLGRWWLFRGVETTTYIDLYAIIHGLNFTNTQRMIFHSRCLIVDNMMFDSNMRGRANNLPQEPGRGEDGQRDGAFRTWGTSPLWSLWGSGLLTQPRWISLDLGSHHSRVSSTKNQEGWSTRLQDRSDIRMYNIFWDTRKWWYLSDPHLSSQCIDMTRRTQGKEVGELNVCVMLMPSPGSVYWFHMGRCL